MTTFTIVMSSVILVVLLLTCWQSGGQKDLKRIRQELEGLRAGQTEFIDIARHAIAKAYDKSRQRLQLVRQSLQALKQETAEGLERQTALAQEQLEALAQRLEKKANSGKEATLETAQTGEESIAVSVRRMEARTKLLQAKARATSAVDEEAGNNFDRANQLLNEATELLREARETLGDDHTFDDSLDLMKVTVREAAAAVHIHAENARQKIKQTLTDADRAVDHLESDEREAAGKSP